MRARKQPVENKKGENMSDFWAKENIRSKKRYVNIDGIFLAKKPAKEIEPEQTIIKKRKIRFSFIFSIAIGLIIFSLVFSSGLFAVSASKNKLNVVNLFSNGKYLIIFQNNSELRPTGGFIGSFAVATINNYKITSIDFNANIYKLDQNFSAEHTVIPPEPLFVICNGKWTLRDSNFAVSFSEAAKQIEWFYNQETGEEIDGIIAINASVVSDLLKITGPINLENYNTQITNENFFSELTTQIEKKYYETTSGRDENEPKSILKDMFPKLLNKLTNTNKIELFKFFSQKLEEKQILFYSKNEKTQKAILSENWGGEVKTFSGDYLQVNNANIGGGKSSLSVLEKIDYEVNGVENNLQASLAITRSHAGTNKWPDGENHNYLKVLVPLSSKLTSAQLNGSDVLGIVKESVESGKTYFAIHLITKPGTSDVLNLKYDLPKTIKEKDYRLLAQKQSGNLGDEFSVKFNNKIMFDGLLNTDKEIK